MKFLLAQKQAEIFAVINIRKTVFINEQNVDVNEELDAYDYEANHFLIKLDNNFVATARVYYENQQATIGRVAVLKNFRKQGLASYLMKETINFIKKQEIGKINIGAQLQAVGFYEKLGFKISGDLYLDANIEHYPMEMIL